MKGCFPNYILLLSFAALLLAGCENSSESAPSAYFQSPSAGHADSRQSPVTDNHVSTAVAHSVQNMLDRNNTITADTAVAVADFVTLAATYDRSSMLGKYLGQAYLTALHNAGITTIDYQVTGDIRVTPDGNFGLTQDYLELANKVNANAVLVGTITPSLLGVTVHARIVDNDSQNVIAADQFFLSKDKVRNSVIDVL